MSTVFSVVDASSWPVHRDETVGSKRKIWLRDPQDRRWLFKYKHRSWTGDDWAEKVAAEVAGALNLAHAHAPRLAGIGCSSSEGFLSKSWWLRWTRSRRSERPAWHDTSRDVSSNATATLC